MSLTTRDLACRLESTLILPDATADAVRRFCEEARTLGLAAVCLNPARILLAHHQLLESEVKVCALVGFPFGATEGEIKAHETELAIELGAQEIEVVMHLGRFLDGDDRGVLRELRDVVEAADGIPVRVVVESSRVPSADRSRLASLVVESGARYLVTGTGYVTPTLAELKEWREWLGPRMGLKVAVGALSLEAARGLVEAGVDRIGTSAVGDWLRAAPVAALEPGDGEPTSPDR